MKVGRRRSVQQQPNALKGSTRRRGRAPLSAISLLLLSAIAHAASPPLRVSRIRAQLDTLLAAERVDDALALLRAQHPDSRSQVAEWVSDSATVKAAMGITPPRLVCPTSVDRHGVSRRADCTIDHVAAGRSRMVHYMRVHLHDGRELPVYTRGRHGRLPHVGGHVAVAGFTRNGTFFADTKPYECLPSSVPAHVNCSLAGVWTLHSSEAEVAAACAAHDSASIARRRLQYAQLSASSTSGVRSVLAVRVLYGDATNATLYAVTDANYNKYLDYMYTLHGARSFGKVQWNITRTSCIYVLPSVTTANVSIGREDAIESAAIAAMQSASPSCYFSPATFQHRIYMLPQTSAFTWGGLGSVNGPSVWLNGQGNSMEAILAHEIGHNYGLYHASTWTATSGKAEYGDGTDVMGTSFNMVTGDYNAAYKHAMGWIDNSYVIQLDVSTRMSAVFLLAALDRNNALLAPPPALSPNTYLTARVPIRPRAAYMDITAPSFLYLNYRSQHATGRNGVYLVETPMDTARGEIGNSFLVCVNDATCKQQLPVFSNDAYVYDSGDTRLLVEVGAKVRVLPGAANSTDQDSAFTVRMALLGMDGLPLDPALPPGCDALGCWSPPPVQTATCGVTSFTLNASSPVSVFMMDPSVTANVTVTTCPPAGSPALSIPVGISVFYGAFPVAHAYYGGNVGMTGDLFSNATYNFTGGSVPCGTLTFIASPPSIEWIVVAAPAAYRSTTVQVTMTLTCGGALPLTFFPNVFVPASACSIPGTYTLVPGLLAGGRPVWTRGSRFLLWGAGCRNTWIVADSINTCAAAYCSFGTSNYTTSKPTFGICSGGGLLLPSGECASACPPGMVVSPGSTICTCTGEWAQNATGQCSGPSVGGPTFTRSASSIVAPTAAVCSQNFLVNASGVCVPCPPGSNISVAGASACTFATWYKTVILSGVSNAGVGTWFMTDVLWNDAPVYKQATRSRFLQLHTSIQWSVVANIGDFAAFAFISTPFRRQPPQFLSSTSYALCDAVGTAAFDSDGRRVCTCPAGSSPDATGTCSLCPMGTYALPTAAEADACVVCPAGVSTTAAAGASVCNSPYCTGFRLAFASPCSGNFAGCAAALTDCAGNYTLLSAAQGIGLPSYVRTDGTRYMYFSSSARAWVLDSDLNATTVLYTQIGSDAFAAPFVTGLRWQSAQYWYVTPFSNATCIQCGAGSYGAPNTNGSGCMLCSSPSRTTVMTSSLAVSNASVCTCAAGFGGASCTACNATTFKASAGPGSCAPCPFGQVSTASGGTSCACPSGYTLNNSSNACVDINECAASPSPCGGTCANSVGSFTCSCPVGQALRKDGRSCTSCGTTHVGNGSACVACPMFTEPDAVGVTCMCPAAYINSSSSCDPPRALLLTTASGLAGSLTLRSIQYINVPTVADAVGVSTTSAKIASPVFQRQSNGSDAIGSNMWLYWAHRAPWGVGSARGSRWALDSSPSLVNSSIPSTSVNGSYGYATFAAAYPPVTTSTPGAVWSLFQRFPFRVFNTSAGVVLSVPTAATAAQPLVRGVITNSTAPGSSVTVQLSGVAGVGDVLAFLPLTSTACNSSLSGSSGNWMLDASLSATIVTPTAPGSWQLCMVSIVALEAESAPASARAVTGADGSVLVLQGLAVASSQSASPSLTAIVIGSTSPSLSASGISVAGGSVNASTSVNSTTGGSVSPTLGASVSTSAGGSGNPSASVRSSAGGSVNPSASMSSGAAGSVNPSSSGSTVPASVTAGVSPSGASVPGQLNVTGNSAARDSSTGMNGTADVAVGLSAGTSARVVAGTEISATVGASVGGVAALAILAAVGYVLYTRHTGQTLAIQQLKGPVAGISGQGPTAEVGAPAAVAPGIIAMSPFVMSNPVRSALEHQRERSQGGARMREILGTAAVSASWPAVAVTRES